MAFARTAAPALARVAFAFACPGRDDKTELVAQGAFEIAEAVDDAAHAVVQFGKLAGGDAVHSDGGLDFLALGVKDMRDGGFLQGDGRYDIIDRCFFVYKIKLDFGH